MFPPSPLLTPVYRGRFAPSPTGPLHFGSLVAAVGSFLQARHAGGQWLVRMEDVDIPRSAPGAGQAILETLEALGLRGDGPVLVQSARGSAYQEAVEALQEMGWAYPCGCSRKEVGGPIYPGTCRRGLRPGHRPRAVRLRTPEGIVTLHDALQGAYSQYLEAEVGDFVIQRADGVFAYQLAVVVDDAAQGVTEVVRGSDLLDSAPRQIHLQRLLGLPTPRYAHLPVAVDNRGDKLSKQTRATPVDAADPIPNLLRVLNFLGQQPPRDLCDATLPQLWEWAIGHWRLDTVPAVRAIREPDR